MIKYDEIFLLMPYIVCVWIILNILGNTIKMTFKINSKYIVWILLIISLIINLVFVGFNFKGFFIGFLTYSFSVSSYDLIKYTGYIINKK